MSLTVRGLVAELASAAGDVDDRADDATKHYAEKVAAAQRGAAPVGPTGDTRDTIGVERADEEEHGGWLAGTETWYAHFIEGGTSKLAPRPFIGPAGDQYADAYAAAVLDIGADI